MRPCTASGGLLMVMIAAVLGGCTVAPVLMPIPSSGRPVGQGASSSVPPKAQRSSQAGPMARQNPSVPAVPPAARPPASGTAELAQAGGAAASPDPTAAAMRTGLQVPEDTRLQRLRDEAEAAYQGRQTQAAIEAFVMLVELDPQDARAWLRLGNLYQRKPDIAAAARAYRRAADLRADGREAREVRQKALLNLTLLGIERARQALAELDREALEPALADARGDGRRQLDELIRGIDATLTRQPVAVAPGAPPAFDAAVGGSIDGAHGRERHPVRPPASEAMAGGSVDEAAPTRAGQRSPRRGAPRRADAAAHRPTGEPDAVNDAARGEGPVRIDYLQGRPAR